ncbi:thiamine-phosphate synthase family protein [Halococcoides cellulosivorans]|uniref:Transcriptional regulator n=1 Tax=Halococcoides cellulosivorans TaxID=1679096 RepID=A0A2R4X086_9EURY|nr:thiamine-phosphate synthase family protein [Halococcoides cellulosivorans]AWB27204.1 transcriptional regulator [Halococcoides cellulosivorans]
MGLVAPQELVVEHVLPPVRALIARRLADRDLTQQQIADRLGVTQAAVSQYLSGDPPGGEIAGHPETTAAVESIAAELAAGDEYAALADLLELIETLEDRGPLCTLHEAESPELEGMSCDLCVRGPDERVAAERETLATVRKAARILAQTGGMAEFVPAVGTNVGSALPGATDPIDVAAIPGRIYAIQGRVEVPANPEFGASRHVARAILAARDVDPAIGGALNLATRDGLFAAARERGIEPLAFDADHEDHLADLRDALVDRGSVPRVVYHPGGFALEPITYVLGSDAVSAARLAADLVVATE